MLQVSDRNYCLYFFQLHTKLWYDQVLIILFILDINQPPKPQEPCVNFLDYCTNKVLINYIHYITGDLFNTSKEKLIGKSREGRNLHAVSISSNCNSLKKH